MRVSCFISSCMPGEKCHPPVIKDTTSFVRCPILDGSYWCSGGHGVLKYLTTDVIRSWWLVYLKFRSHLLHSRFGDLNIPQFRIWDMVNFKSADSDLWLLSWRLIQAVCWASASLLMSDRNPVLPSASSCTTYLFYLWASLHDFYHVGQLFLLLVHLVENKLFGSWCDSLLDLGHNLP